MQRAVYSRIELDVIEPAHLVLQVAPARQPGLTIDETLVVELDGAPQEAREVPDVHRGRVHLLDAEPGRLTITYTGRVTGTAEPIGTEPLDPETYLRPSRYAESDRLGAMAYAEFGHLGTPADLLAGVSSWVGGRLIYVPGSSGPTDGAVDTMLARQGVCRDYAHLVVALLRARDVPARLVAVYAPGLDPMDFHAVAEAHVDGHWQVVDATLLAPRASLLRISTGRDAADTAFLSTYRGVVNLVTQEVRATVDGDLPVEDVTELVALG
ncbi:transglutaminase family protein [Rhodococcus aerolatus]